MVKRFDVYFIDLNPTIGSEINKIRPGVVVSPNQMNNGLNTVIIAPLTSTVRPYPFRVDCVVANKHGQVALDQMRAVDKVRLIKKLDVLNQHTQDAVIGTLLEMFDY